MKRIIRLTESDLAKIVKRVIREQEETDTPFDLKLISPQGFGKVLGLDKSGENFQITNLNICDFFQVKEQGTGKDTYKTKVQFKNISNKGIRVIDADVQSVDLDVYPAPNNKLLAPGQSISFDVEITPGSLKDKFVQFQIMFASVTEGDQKRRIVNFPILNNIGKCAAA